MFISHCMPRGAWFQYHANTAVMTIVADRTARHGIIRIAGLAYSGAAINWTIAISSTVITFLHISPVIEEVLLFHQVVELEIRQFAAKRTNCCAKLHLK